jgi:DNA-binding NarL/FixJ family response regulator
MAQPVRVVVADDHPLFVDGLTAVIDASEDLTLVATATNGEDVVAVARELEPDVVVMDLQMPMRSGVEATRAIKNTHPHIAVLVLTMFDDDDSVFSAVRAGASGYLLKGAAHDQIARGIRVVAAGEAIFGASVAQRVIAYFSDNRRPPNVFPELTSREREVLELVAKGLRNAAIARELFLSEKTVKNYLSNIFSKLQIADRAEAIVRARDAGLG